MPISTFLRDRPPVRGLTWLALSEQAIIQSPQITTAASDDSDAGTGGALVWATQATVACRIYPVTVRGMGRIVGAELSEQSTHYVVTPPGTSIHLQDRVVIANRGTYEVTMILERSDAQTTMFEVFRVT
jgi:hypothetical protein